MIGIEAVGFDTIRLDAIFRVAGVRLPALKRATINPVAAKKAAQTA